MLLSHIRVGLVYLVSPVQALIWTAQSSSVVVVECMVGWPVHVAVSMCGVWFLPPDNSY